MIVFPWCVRDGSFMIISLQLHFLLSKYLAFTSYHDVKKIVKVLFWFKVPYFPVYTHPGPSGGYPDPMSYMMDGNQMMHRPPGDAAFHQGYHYPPAEYYPHHL